MPKAAFVTVTAVVLLHLSSDASADCACGPASSNPTGRTFVFDDPLVPDTYQSLARQAGNMWSHQFSIRGMPNVAVGPGGGDIRVAFVPDDSLESDALADLSHNILFLRQRMRTEANDYVRALFLHEWGHFLTFDQSPCPGQSVMSDTSASSYRTNFTGCDTEKLNSDYGIPTIGDGDYYPGCDYNCGPSSPLILALDGAELQLTAPSVWFDFFGRNRPLYLSWTAPDASDGFLVLDRDGDGLISSGSELFGNPTPLSWGMNGERAGNGFRALHFFDRVCDGGNQDGEISDIDSVYNFLRIWVDRNHNGFSEAWELFTMRELGVVSIDLETRQSLHRDPYGNQYTLRSHFIMINPAGRPVVRTVYDVYLVSDKD